MSDHTDISDLITPLCERLGLKPGTVATLTLKPREVVATIFLERDDGSKYIGENGMAATEERTFLVQT